LQNTACTNQSFSQIQAVCLKKNYCSLSASGKKQKKGHGLMKEIYQLNKEELFRTCGNPEGLTTTDAKERLQTYGENALVEQKLLSFFTSLPICSLSS
jgi:hypothetical protein